MKESSWFMLTVMIGLIAFFGWLSIHSISTAISDIAEKSEDWKEITIQLNTTLDKAIILQKEQNQLKKEESQEIVAIPYNSNQDAV